jgi:hypothetical protein
MVAALVVVAVIARIETTNDTKTPRLRRVLARRANNAVRSNPRLLAARAQSDRFMKFIRSYLSKDGNKTVVTAPPNGPQLIPCWTDNFSLIGPAEIAKNSLLKPVFASEPPPLRVDSNVTTHRPAAGIRRFPAPAPPERAKAQKKAATETFSARQTKKGRG